MSGHSKWSTIKRQKGAQDLKRGKTFTKISNAITIAVKQGGGGEGASDPSKNFKLRLAMDAAKAANMPKENIERAVKRALGREGGELSEVTYEGFGPGGFYLIIEATTNNKQRTTADIKNIFDKAGASFGQPGSVSYNFENLGRITVSQENTTGEEVFSQAVESGAEDVEILDGEVIVYTKPQELGKVRDELVKKKMNIKDAELTRRAKNLISIEEQGMKEKVEAFLDKLSELEDVQEVYTNLSIN